MTLQQISLTLALFFSSSFVSNYCLQNEARKMNHQEVVDEDRRKKLPANFDKKRKFVEWEENEEKKRKVSK